MFLRISILFVTCLTTGLVHAQHDLDRLLPATTAAAFKINHAGQIVDDILAHPLVQAAEEAGAYKDALPEQQAAQ